MHFFKFLGVYPVRAAQLWPLKLMENGGLHAEVQRQIRSHGLATGTIKRGVANIVCNIYVYIIYIQFGTLSA